MKDSARKNIKKNHLVLAMSAGIVGLLLLVVGTLLFLTISENTKAKVEMAKRFRYLRKTYSKELTLKRVVKPLKIPVIMYHYVENITDPNDTTKKKLDINPVLFEDHLITLKKGGYETYFVKDIPKIISGEIHYKNKIVILTFDDGYEDFYRVVYPLLKKYNMKATEYVINNYLGRKGFLTAEEVKEMSDSEFIEIGAHTMDHLNLKHVSRLVAKKQIKESKKGLEEIIGKKVETFAYPYGSFNPDTLSIVKEASFSAAVSVIPGLYQSEDNLFYLSRVRAGVFSSFNMGQILENWKEK